ncbi:hypothetical protein [Cognatilysobacter terrigena]|uniref:hypothetical protein n=1 Tax=Cognatilysobacter terrigena TaxID=2488749 RepID=UPI00105F7EF4|nr:hypothetical protein [Lysobacter terrigena]
MHALARTARIALLACVLPLSAYAAEPTSDASRSSAEWWADVNVASYHFENADDYLGRGRHFNQSNYGAGVEVQWQPRHAVSAGYFRNSVYEDSWYALYHYTPLALGRYVRVGGMVGLVNGYPGYNDGHAAPAGALVAKIEYRRVGMNLIYLPRIPGSTPNTLGLQLKVRLDR